MPQQTRYLLAKLDVTSTCRVQECGSLGHLDVECSTHEIGETLEGSVHCL